MGGTGLRPVVSGVARETIAGCEQGVDPAHIPQWRLLDKIRRDVGFDERDARATVLAVIRRAKL
jgi:hypothetical protein